MPPPSNPPRPLLVAGVMSGTSADGIDVALCRIAPARTPNTPPRLKLLGHLHTPYPQPLREAVLRAMDASAISVADLSRLNWRLGEAYAVAVAKASAALDLKPQLLGLHGQTLYHQAVPAPFAGRPTRATWQTGEPAVLAERLRIPIVSDLRPADLAAGGQAAPLVPMLDYALFRHPTRNRVLLNLGGIANLTAIPAAASLDQLLAFDTGPANMVIDALMTRYFHKPYDRAGATAERGTVLPTVLSEFRKQSFFAATPPKSCGREQFGSTFAYEFRSACKAASPSREDAIATATEFTRETILRAYTRFVWPHLGQTAPLARGTDLVVSGGGARNTYLLRRMELCFKPLGVRILTSDSLGLPAQAKEAAAFALLAWLTVHGLPGNVPAATGASRPVILGKITPAG